MMKRSGLTMWEIVLFMVMLAIAGGTSVFFFFLNSDDVKLAEKKYDWIKNTNKIVDEISIEIANSVEFEYPFDSESTNCLFKRAINSASQDPSLVENGFDFAGGNLTYVVKNGQVKSKKAKFNGIKNPIISGCSDGKFVRKGPAKLLFSFSLREPGGSGNKRKFRRIIYLRNI